MWRMSYVVLVLETFIAGYLLGSHMREVAEVTRQIAIFGHGIEEGTRAATGRS